jgi:hypothetical protein
MKLILIFLFSVFLIGCSSTPQEKTITISKNRTLSVSYLTTKVDIDDNPFLFIPQFLATIRTQVEACDYSQPFKNQLNKKADVLEKEFLTQVGVDYSTDNSEYRDYKLIYKTIHNVYLSNTTNKSCEQVQKMFSNG